MTRRTRPIWRARPQQHRRRRTRLGARDSWALSHRRTNASRIRGMEMDRPCRPQPVATLAAACRCVPSSAEPTTDAPRLLRAPFSRPSPTTRSHSGGHATRFFDRSHTTCANSSSVTVRIAPDSSGFGQSSTGAGGPTNTTRAPGRSDSMQRASARAVGRLSDSRVPRSADACTPGGTPRRRSVTSGDSRSLRSRTIFGLVFPDGRDSDGAAP